MLCMVQPLSRLLPLQSIDGSITSPEYHIRSMIAYLVADDRDPTGDPSDPFCRLLAG